MEAQLEFLAGEPELIGDESLLWSNVDPTLVIYT